MAPNMPRTAFEDAKEGAVLASLTAGKSESGCALSEGQPSAMMKLKRALEKSRMYSSANETSRQVLVRDPRRIPPLALFHPD